METVDQQLLRLRIQISLQELLTESLLLVAGPAVTADVAEAFAISSEALIASLLVGATRDSTVHVMEEEVGRMRQRLERRPTPTP
jgi:hypothetical protein